MSKINLRSPYFITVTNTNLTRVDLELYIYTGTQTTNRGSVKYTIESNAYNNSVTFEISELSKDYLEYVFDGTYTGQNVWVDYRANEYISDVAQGYGSYVQLSAFDGYGYFEQGSNPQNDKSALISNNKLIILEDSDIRIPISTNETDSVTYLYNGETVYTQTISDTTSSSSLITYIDNGVDGADTFRDRVLLDGGTYEDNQCIRELLDDYNTFAVDEIIVSGDYGSEVIKVEQLNECRYTPYKLTFINKYGALQDLWFFKRSNLTISTTEEKYKSNIVASGTYNISSHQSKIFTKQGKEKLNLNSGYYPETYNDVFKQMLLSESVWIEVDGDTLPIIVSSSSLAFKTQLNDKLINYTIDVDYAFDKINTIR